MNTKLTTALWVIWYALLAGGSLAIFTMIPNLSKMIFSLLTIYVGIRFFRRFETLGLRVAFIISAIVLFFIIVTIRTMIQFIKDNPELFAAAI